MNKDKIELDVLVLRDHSSYDRISYVQGANAIPIILHIRDYDVPSGSTARVYVRRPDGTIEYDVATVSGNDVAVNVKTSMFSVAGNSILQVKIIKGSAILITFGITVCVKPNHMEEKVKGENVADIVEKELGAIKAAVEKAKEEAESYKDTAMEKAEAAERSAENAANSAKAAKTSETNADASKRTAELKAQEASASAEAAKISETNAGESADTAALKAKEASDSEKAAKESEDNASLSAASAEKNAADAEKSSADAAKSADDSENYSKVSKSWAVGGTDIRNHEDADNSKYYSQQSKNSSEISKEYLTKVEHAGDEALNKIQEALGLNIPVFMVDLGTGHLLYEGGSFDFAVNNGNLEWGLTV
ncbi:MAG: hypothetical protein HFH13_04525 [Dorea sp.]|nr:hypothetical protein [Dorea sp.]